MSTPKLSFLQRVALEVIWLNCRIFAIMPRWYRYGVVARLVCALLRLVGYRSKVVVDNLKNAFPEKSEEEIERIKNGFYYNISQIFVETISMPAMSDEDCRRANRITNIEVMCEDLKGKNWIAAMAHQGCWEFNTFYGVYQSGHVQAGVYSPLHNRVADALYLRLRERTGLIKLPMNDIMRFCIRNLETGIDGKPIVVALIADQTPPRKEKNNRWFEFFHRDTIFFDGAEKLAMRYNMPVYFVAMKRVKPGFYESTLDLIYDGQEVVEEGVITTRYAKRLEQMITEDPESWLWSHRRWKHDRSWGQQ